MSTLLEQASLVMIPSGYKEDTVYSVIPETGAGDLSFTRASNGTRINSAGLVEVMPYNLLSYSEDFTNGLWTKTQITVSANSTTAPDGTNTADTITDVAVLSGHNTSQVAAISSTSLITASCFIKKNVTRYVGVRLFVPTNGVDVGRFSIVVDLETGLITSTLTSGQTIANLSYSVVDSGNGWYRCIISGTSPVGNASLMTWLTPSGTPSNDGFAATSYLGNGQSVFVWGAQLNIGSTAKEYFPTTDRLNVPRLDYSNGSCPALLLEKQSTNLLTYSEDFTDGNWNKSAVTITGNATTAPNGTNTADLIVPNTTSTNHIVFQAPSTFTTGINYTFSYYAKSESYTKTAIRIGGGGYATVPRAEINLTNGSIIYQQGFTTLTVVNSGNGWYRICGTLIAASGLTPNIQPLSDSYSVVAENYVYAGDGTSGIYIWGAQLEQSSYATSYIPTTNASATRVADRCLSIGTPLLLNDFSIFISIKFSQINQPLGYMIFGSVNSASISRIYIDSGTNMSFTTLTTTTAIGVAGLSINTDYKICFTRSGTTLKYFRNGVLINTFTVQSEQFNFTTFCNAVDGGGDTSKYNTLGFLKEGIVFPNALTNEEAINLTAL